MHFWFGAVRDDYRNQQTLTLKRISTYSSLVLKISHVNKVGAWKMEAFSHYAGSGKYWEVIRSIDFENFQLADGTRPLYGADLKVHRTARLLAYRPPSLQQLDATNFPKNKM